MQCRNRPGRALIPPVFCTVLASCAAAVYEVAPYRTTTRAQAERHLVPRTCEEDRPETGTWRHDQRVPTDRVEGPISTGSRLLTFTDVGGRRRRHERVTDVRYTRGTGPTPTIRWR